ncbi:leucine--tRNA ligase [Brumimicrobium aurantiacum]|uniref:Leucine--tRNA ligase n=1 Tax=Brumimicrobium aurantiacum TaxID=1737063 RepID=A0A3E1EXD4_9FLAO|nr:leucine--tRNA ligase [Brumimicrobium aurantiacum]RFC54226.1 leucine--tRNA ligase [Brumimicrobium aurantiacum]
MEYNFNAIEEKWRKYWQENNTYVAKIDTEKPKYYGLTMFPYPSGAGLHVGHPLGYIASDIYARYKRLKGFNVLHPMGYDSFGLPAEQYAIQTGQHPAVTTDENLKRYRSQLDKIGFSFDWSKEVRTSDPKYYKWTQWIFKQLFNSFYCNDANKALPLEELIAVFEKEGNANINAVNACEIEFSAEEWKAFDVEKQASILMDYRLTYLADSWVNWCPALGTVLANDEIVNGVSERGGHPVEQKLMRQWSMRITAYAERLLKGLDQLDWSDAVKDIQRNWIGKSVGASVNFKVDNHEEEIEVFTTRPDTIYGVSFMVLAPEHELVSQITTQEYKDEVNAYQQQAGLKSERDRMADTKTISGQFTGAYAVHPLSGEKIQIWIGDYVLASYGTGAVMAVPCGDQRDYDFAKHFEIPIKNIFADVSIEEEAYTEKKGKIANSDFLNGLEVAEAIQKAIEVLEEKKIGKAKTNYRLRDAVFSRQRYWGEPFPVYYDNGVAKTIEDQYLPIELPEVDKYLPTPDGQPPLGNATKWFWDSEKNELTTKDRADEENVHPMELNTMPGWAGSSWYFLRYMDPSNNNEFVAKEKVDYWNNVDLYIGGAEHATGHLLYSRFWSMFLNDREHIPFEEPFQKMINQGMILGRSNFVYRDKDSGKFVSFGKRKEFKTSRIHVDINIVDNDVLDVEAFKASREEYANAEFILEDDGSYKCGHEVEKMSKSKFNVQNPDDLVEKYGADTLRMYEMFLGPIEQAKPWDIKGINGVNNFLKKVWRLFHDQEGNVSLSEDKADAKALKTLHKTIKKAQEDMDRYVFNTTVSALMICVNELTEQKCNNKAILQEMVILLAPYAPHIAEELWSILGNEGSVNDAQYPVCNEDYLVEDAFEYPVSFNGKMRFKVELANSLSKDEIEKEVLGMEKSQKYLDGKTPKKVIVVPGRIVNIVV